MTEKAWQAQVIELARWYGWLTAHFRPGMTKRGRWITAVQGDGKGFPDCLFLRRNRAIAAELKVGKGRVTPEQVKWLKSAGEAGIETYVWRPEHYDEVERILK